MITPSWIKWFQLTICLRSKMNGKHTGKRGWKCHVCSFTSPKKLFAHLKGKNVIASCLILISKMKNGWFCSPRVENTIIWMFECWFNLENINKPKCLIPLAFIKFVYLEKNAYHTKKNFGHSSLSRSSWTHRLTETVNRKHK